MVARLLGERGLPYTPNHLKLFSKRTTASNHPITIPPCSQWSRKRPCSGLWPCQQWLVWKISPRNVFCHLAHWTTWNKWSLYDRSIGVYERFLPSSIERAKKQGYEGARLGKMSDPSGRSAPGQTNNLLIWQQPHPMYFAEMEYHKFPTEKTLQK